MLDWTERPNMCEEDLTIELLEYSEYDDRTKRYIVVDDTVGVQQWNEQLYTSAMGLLSCVRISSMPGCEGHHGMEQYWRCLDQLRNLQCELPCGICAV